MPDLKSELSKVINSWETPVATPTPAYAPSGHRTTTNSTRTTFNYVRDNPGITRSAAIAGLNRAGVPTGSSTSLLATMIARGNIRMTAEGALFAAQPEYKPLPKPKSDKPKAEKAAVAEAPEAAPPAPPEASDVRSVIAKMNVMQAREMYDELRTIFGG